MPTKQTSASSAKWMKRAASSMALAKVAKPAEVVWEDLCFHAQQAVEKALKAVLLYRAIPFRLVHDINELVSALDRNGVPVPDLVKAASELNEYAVEARYPGNYEPGRWAWFIAETTLVCFILLVISELRASVVLIDITC